MSYVIGNVAYIMSKHLSIDILDKTSWNSCIVLSKASLIQINFWKENLGRVNVKSFTSDFSCQSVVYSDASNTGYGGYIVEKTFNIAHDILKDKRITWFSDNQDVVSIVATGSMKPELQDIVLCIFENCLTHNIFLDAEWVPRTFNEKADFISRIIDYDDWGVGEQLFTYFDSLWGPHEIDWFANDDNHKLTVCYSRYWTVNSIGNDAFTVNWNGVNGWFVPPVCLVSKVLRYMRQCMAHGTIVLPLWKSASHWPILCPTDEGRKWALWNGISSEFILPAKPIHVVLYLACLVQQNHSPSINQAFYSMRWAHKITRDISSTDSDLVKNILEGAKRRLSVPVKKKEPTTPDMLSNMFDKFYCEDNLYNQRSICACLLSYSGFLRVSELLNLKTCDVLFFQSHMSVFIQKSKTDIYRDGDRIIIARTGNKLCPVKNLEKYLEWSNN
ncbi:unnamed protein product [Mytilus edulis]|uniref:Tyr recombinase domain-containing protein n=1 Tax=Mytilus edulis TaxID=6550 RepID=A0A8S3UTJ2_MYTED|nr:unnamed protein product [Mytilus edulis]